MVYSRIRNVVSFLLLNLLLVDAQKVISLKGYYTCSLHPSNELWLELRAWDENGYATRMNAVDSQEEEITACPISGTGTTTSPFYMTSKIRRTDDVEVFNVCGMTKTTVDGRTVYNWRVRAYTYDIDDYPNNRDFALSLQCDTGDLLDGRVETIVDIDVPDLTVYAANPADVTGLGSIATNANIVYSANLYPNGRSLPDALSDAKGFYLYNCYSANNAEMTNRERFIDDQGCRVPGAAYAPTSSFRSVQNSGDYIKIEAQFANAVPIDNQNDIFITCMVGKCTGANDVRCLDVCTANTNNLPASTAVNTDVTFSTSFTVQDQVAHRLSPTRTTDTNTVLASVNVGEPISIVAFNSPGGIGGSNDLLNAKGFYVYNCRYATNKQMNNPTQFINNAGCSIPNTKLTPASVFATDDALTSPDSNRYVTKSGSIVVQNVGNVRYWVECDCGMCLVPDHNYCEERCGAEDNIPGGATNLGYVGHRFTLSVLDTVNVQATQINLQAANGQTITSSSDPVSVGESINFSVEVTPSGTGAAGAAFTNAKGIFIRNCYPTVNGQRKPNFIGDKGCPVPDSPYRTSGNCVAANVVDGVPPFKIDCGTISVPDEGDVLITCEIQTCTTASNAFCKNRCAAGDITPDSNVVDPGVTTSSAFKTEEGDDRRTAVKSEELRAVIAAVSAVGAVLVLLGVFLGACCILSKQKSLAKRRKDRRLYNY